MSAIADFAKRTRELGSVLAHMATDGWFNEMTGLGTAADKAAANRYCPPAPMSYEECEALYNFDDVANTAIGQIVIDSMGGGFGVKRAADSDDEKRKASEQAAAIKRRLRLLGAYKHLTDGATWARMCGGAGILLGLTGAGAFDEPLPIDEAGRIAKTAKILWLRTVTRRELTVYQYDGKGEPELYTYSPVLIGGQPGDIMQAGAIVVHQSRILFFSGARTAPNARLKNQGWDLSVLDRVWAVMSASTTKWQSVTHMFSDMSQSVFKIKGLIGLLAEGKEGQDTITERVRWLNRFKSVARSIVLDAGRSGEPGEEYELVERSAMTGLDALLSKDLLRLCMCLRMPATVLVGMQPAGLSATGEMELQLWDSQCTNYRTLELVPVAEVLVSLVANELGFDAEGWEIDWPALRVQSDKERAETTKLKVDTAVAAIGAEMLLPEEGALALQAMGLDVEIDREARQEILKMRLEDLKNPPPPPEVPGDDADEHETDPEGDPAQEPGSSAQPGRARAVAAGEDDPEAE